MKYSKVIFLSIILFFVTRLDAFCNEKHHIDDTQRFSEKSYTEEGFGKGTLVRVPYGYKHIESLTANDVILGDDLQPKRILKLSKRIAQQSVLLTIGDTSLCLGCDQVVRLSCKSEWRTACDLQDGDGIVDLRGYAHRVEHSEVIPEITELYQLTVEDHIFCVGTADIVVHNSDAASIGTTILFLEYISYVHPVIAIVGSSIALSVIAYKAYESYQQKRQGIIDNKSIVDLQHEVFLAERRYYENRRQELIKLKDEFSAIYRDITMIRELFNSQVTTFSSQFLQSKLRCHAPSHQLTISIADELQLTDEYKAILRKVREQELELLENEISKVQAILVVHFNELIDQVNDGINAYNDMREEIQKAIDLWNNNRYVLTDQIASRTLEMDIKEECLLNDLQRKLNELKAVNTYYRQTKLTAMRRSTNIKAQSDWAVKFVAETKQWVDIEIKRVINNVHISDEYFAQKGISTTNYKNHIKNCFNQNQINKNMQSIKKAQKKLSHMGNNGGPGNQKRPKDDKKNKSKTVGDILKGAKLRQKKGLTEQYEKSGGYQEAVKDFGDLGLSEVKNISNIKGKKQVGTLPNGQKVVVRDHSSSKTNEPTLEVQPLPNEYIKIKIRYVG